MSSFKSIKTSQPVNILARDTYKMTLCQITDNIKSTSDFEKQCQHSVVMKVCNPNNPDAEAKRWLQVQNQPESKSEFQAMQGSEPELLSLLQNAVTKMNCRTLSETHLSENLLILPHLVVLAY